MLFGEYRFTISAMSPEDFRTESPLVCTSLGRPFFARFAVFCTLTESVFPSVSRSKTMDRL